MHVPARCVLLLAGHNFARTYNANLTGLSLDQLKHSPHAVPILRLNLAYKP